MYKSTINLSFALDKLSDNYILMTKQEEEIFNKYGSDGFLFTDNGIEINLNIEEELEQQEKLRIAHLHLTKREVFLGLYNAKQVTPDMIKAQITEPSALIEFEYATEYYRGNPLIDIIGAKLNITPKQLDLFFEYNDYLYLTNCTLTINATPTDAIVKINDKETKTQTVPYSTIVDYEVSATDYITQNNSIELKQDEKIDIVLSKIEDKQETV